MTYLCLLLSTTNVRYMYANLDKKLEKKSKLIILSETPKAYN